MENHNMERSNVSKVCGGPETLQGTTELPDARHAQSQS